MAQYAQDVEHVAHTQWSTDDMVVARLAQLLSAALIINIVAQQHFPVATLQEKDAIRLFCQLIIQTNLAMMVQLIYI